jgi:two-component system LytT family response regulator
LRVERNYVDVVTAGSTWLHRETLKSLLERLDPARFVQVSRLVVVALAKVRGIVRDGAAEIILDGGHRFAISRRFQLAVERALER